MPIPTCWRKYTLTFVRGIGAALKTLWDLKLRFEALPIPFASVLADKEPFLFNPCGVYVCMSTCVQT